MTRIKNESTSQRLISSLCDNKHILKSVFNSTPYSTRSRYGIVGYNNNNSVKSKSTGDGMLLRRTITTTTTTTKVQKVQPNRIREQIMSITIKTNKRIAKPNEIDTIRYQMACVKKNKVYITHRHKKITYKNADTFNVDI
jgi:hypothetical protein